jgi:hypothetical protein
MPARFTAPATCHFFFPFAIAISRLSGFDMSTLPLHVDYSPSKGRSKCSTVPAIHASTSSRLRTSTCFQYADTPFSVKVLARCCTASPSLSARERSAPLFASSSTVARPMPEAAPVMAKRWPVMEAMAVVEMRVEGARLKPLNNVSAELWILLSLKLLLPSGESSDRVQTTSDPAVLLHDRLIGATRRFALT